MTRHNDHPTAGLSLGLEPGQPLLRSQSTCLSGRPPPTPPSLLQSRGKPASVKRQRVSFARGRAMAANGQRSVVCPPRPPVRACKLLVSRRGEPVWPSG